MKLIYEWTLPTLNADGSAIPASGPGSLVYSRIQFGKLNPLNLMDGFLIEERMVRAGEASAEFDAPTPGTYFGQAFATNTYGHESDEGEAALYIVGAPA